MCFLLLYFQWIEYWMNTLFLCNFRRPEVKTTHSRDQAILVTLLANLWLQANWTSIFFSFFLKSFYRRQTEYFWRLRLEVWQSKCRDPQFLTWLGNRSWIVRYTNDSLPITTRSYIFCVKRLRIRRKWTSSGFFCLWWLLSLRDVLHREKQENCFWSFCG